MIVLNTLLFWIHLSALTLGGAAAFGLPVVGMQMAGATPEGRASLVKAMMMLGRMGSAALGLLVLTGLIMVWSVFGGVADLPGWFWAKMVLVVAFGTLIGFSRRNAGKAMAGDQAAAARQPKFALAGVVVLLSIVLTAVLAFS